MCADSSNTSYKAPLSTPDKTQRTRMHDYMDFVTARIGKPISGSDDLHKWSIEQNEDFWSYVWDFCGVEGDKGNIIIEHTPDVPWAKFFTDSKINYTENVLKHAKTLTNAPAIIARTQDSSDLVITWNELQAHIGVWERSLRAAGIEKGDHVCAYLPNIPETVIVFLACAAIGAVFVSAGMEMGADDLISRFSQVKPKLFITADGYIHGAKKISRLDTICKVHSKIPSIQETIVLPLISDTQETFEKLDRIRCIDDFLTALSPEDIEFERHDFNHPLYILFSSGTTGVPKCFEHSTGGVLLKHLCELALQSDVNTGDRVFYHATPSWMMWNWLVSALTCGATILLYDGAPAYPNAYAQWNFTTEHGCTHHGSAAPLILSWAQAKMHPATRDDYDLSPLRMVMSTGAVLPEEGFEFINQYIKPGVKISSIAGGTDIVGCFIGGNPLMPTYGGQINGPMLGMDVQIWNEEGACQPENTPGELVCVNAFPSMPLRFLNDKNGDKYREAYFTAFPGRRAWRHGDTLLKTPEEQYILMGRSDATLNQNGVRIGAVSIYKQLGAFVDQIEDYAAVDFMRPDNRQSITILFLKLKSSEVSVPDDLQKSIRTAVKDNVTPYAIPTEIIAAPKILTTPNGKRAEVVIKKILNGKEIPNPSLYGEENVAFYQDVGQSLAQKYRKESA